MKKNGWTQHELEELCKDYQDKTGVLDFRPTEIAVWAKAQLYTMPEPPTDVQLLARLLQHAAVKAHRKDAKMSILYRAALAYPVKIKDEWQMRWFDADGPAATVDKVIASIRRRKDMALNILVSARASWERWKQLHPTEQTDLLDLGISDDEVEWRLLGKTNEDEQRKAG
jgi:hypothetical protein